MVYVFLADGFELIEALAPVDMLRRAKIGVMTVGIGGSVITASCGVSVTCDISDKAFRFKNVDAIVLPGGMPGTKNLEKSPVVQDAIDKAAERNTLICAICAAPSILGHKGLLNEKEDGFIINAMHSREGCYTYIKEIIAGNCVIILSDEEKEALEMAKAYK